MIELHVAVIIWLATTLFEGVLFVLAVWILLRKHEVREKAMHASTIVEVLSQVRLPAAVASQYRRIEDQGADHERRIAAIEGHLGLKPHRPQTPLDLAR